MSIVIVRPTSDDGPNQGNPIPSGPHYAQVDEDPHDGDATRIEFTSAGQIEAFRVDVSPIPDDAQIVSLAVRKTAKKGQAACVGTVGIKIGATYYPAGQSNLGASYQAQTIDVVHPDGQPWTKDRIASALPFFELADLDFEGGATNPRLTQLVYVVNYLTTPPPPPAPPVVPYVGVITSRLVGTLEVGGQKIAPHVKINYLDQDGNTFTPAGFGGLDLYPTHGPGITSIGTPFYQTLGEITKNNKTYQFVERWRLSSLANSPTLADVVVLPPDW